MRLFILCLLNATSVLAQSTAIPKQEKTLTRASVEGDVYLLNRGGDVKPGAANEIALLHIDDKLRAKWESLCQSQAQDFKVVVARRDSIQKTLVDPTQELAFIDATLKWMSE